MGRPGIGVQGVGLHTGGPATNGTVTVAGPAPIARRLAVKLLPEPWLDVRVNVRPSEMVGGPGQVPPVPAKPPERRRVEPTVTHTGVASSDGCQGASTVPVEHGTLVGVGMVAMAAAGSVVAEVSGGCVEEVDADGAEHPATIRPVATDRTSRLIDTPTM